MSALTRWISLGKRSETHRRGTGSRVILAGLALATAALTGTAWTPTASAGDVQWSVTIGSSSHRHERPRREAHHRPHYERSGHRHHRYERPHRSHHTVRVAPCPPRVVVVRPAPTPHRYVVRSTNYRPLVVPASRYGSRGCDDRQAVRRRY